MAISDRVAVMNNGKLEQVGAADELYEEPRSLFVADFIGESNNLEGRLVERDDHMCRVALGEAVECMAKPIGAPKPGTPVRVVVRPERVLMDRELDSDCCRLTATVQDVSYVGESIRYQLVAAGDLGLVMRVPNRGYIGRMSAGDELVIGWRARDCMVFAPDQESLLAAAT
jgi:putative spermidine/putrescine transport system ATP-binding protein